MNLIEIIEKYSNDYRNIGITFVQGEFQELFLSYRDLYYGSLSVLSKLYNCGLKRGDELILQIDNNELYIKYFWACLMGGIIPIPLTVGIDNEKRLKLINIMRILKKSYLVTTRPYFSLIFNFIKENDCYDLIDKIRNKTIFIEDPCNINAQNCFTNDSDIAYVQFSSGSTDNPKGIILTHKNLISNINAIINAIKSNEDEISLSWMPLTHDMGLIGFHLCPLVAGYHQLIMPTELFLRRPNLWLKKIYEHKVTVTCSPNFGYKYLLKHFICEQSNQINLSSLRLIFNGAEPISSRLCYEFLNTLAPCGLKRNVMFPVYGLAEAGLAVSFPTPEKEIITVNVDRDFLKIGDRIKEVNLSEDAVSFVEVGSAVNNCYIRIIDNKGNVVNDNIVGHIQIKGDNVTSGYYNNAEATNEAKTSDGWFRTGDVGFYRKGHLIITGRKKDIIFINGQNYYPSDIENIAEKMEEIEFGKIAVVGYYNDKYQKDDIVIFILFREKTIKFIPIYLKLKKYINQQLGIEITNIIPVIKIPKTTSGKIQRYKLIEMYKNGQFKNTTNAVKKALNVVLIQHDKQSNNPNEIKLLQILENVLEIKNISLEDDFLKQGGDSLRAMHLLTRISDEFNVELQLKHIFYSKTIREIAHEIDNAQVYRHSKIKPTEQLDYYPTSSAQKRLFFLHELDKISIVYNLPYFIIIEGDVDVDKLNKIFTIIIKKHKSFRTSFHIAYGEPIQKIHENVNFKIDYENVYDYNIERKIEEFVVPFDLSQAPLLRIKMLKINDKKHILLLDVHHIIIDGESFVTLIIEFNKLYMGQNISIKSIDYPDYVLWLLKQKNSRKYQQQKTYWLQQFEDEIPTLNLRTDYQRPVIQSFEGDAISFEIGKSMTDTLMMLAKNIRVTLFAVLFSIFNIFLSKLSDQKDVIIGTVIANRKNHEINNIIGMFVNVQVQKNTINEKETFVDFLKRVQDKLLIAFENQEYQFEDLVEHISVKRDPSRNPLFDVLFTLQFPETVDTIIPGLKLKTYNYKNKIARFDLILRGIVNSGKLLFTFEYCTKLFKSITIKKYISYFNKITNDILSDSNVKIKNIEIISDKEKKQILYDFNNTNMYYPKSKTIHELFEVQVKRTPDKISAVFEEKHITYKELNARSILLANLLREKGVKPNVVVGIMVKHSLEMLVGIMGILKSGGGYLPIDPDTPETRIISILEDCQASLLLTDSSSIKKHSFTSLQNLGLSKIKIFVTGLRSPITNLDDLPIPDRSLVNYEKYHKYIGLTMVKNSITILASRGCPYHCAYCHKIWPKKHISRSAENVFLELKLYNNIGVKRFAFYDDIFNFDIKNTIELFKLIIENKLNIQLFFPAGLRGDILTNEYIDLMIKAGTVDIAVALETASPRLQKLIRKNLDIEKLYRNLEYLCEKYPEVISELQIMHGFPTETEEEAMMTLDFLKKLRWIHFPYIHILKIYSNTDMEKIAIENGLSRNKIVRSENLAYHELPDTLPFEKSFTKNYQTIFLNEYFLSKERLLQVLPQQIKILSEDEIVQKYNSYLPVCIKSLNDLLSLAGITSDEIEYKETLSDNRMVVSKLNEKIAVHFPKNKPFENALKLLLLDLSQFFSSECDMLYDVVEPPLGLMYIITYLNKQLNGYVNGKIAKSRHDFDNYEELETLLTNFKPDIIGIRSLTYYRDFLHKTVALIRQWGIDVPIIIGGPYATSDYETILQDRNIDIVILGEGEVTFTELIKKVLDFGGKLPDGEILKQIEGIAFIERKNNIDCNITREIVMLDEYFNKPQEDSDANLEHTNQSTDLAYVIYTSGSTGQPMGVMIEHKALVNLSYWHNKFFSINIRDRATKYAGFGFDASVWEIFPYLINGICIYIINESLKLDLDKFNKYLERNNITIGFLPTQVYVQFAKYKNSSLRTLLTGGDKLNYYRKKSYNLINNYGPTENTVVTTSFIVNNKYRNIPIGKPIYNTKVYICNKSNNLQPVGISGELCISGEGLARGYFQNQLLTSEKFVKNPFIIGDRIYKTGDLARWLPNGNIEILGRLDDQIKIRGYRIEPREIEKQLLMYNGIKEALVIAREDRNKEKYLCAYIISEKKINISKIREYLSLQIPEYMLPSYIVQLNNLPLTPNGKVDKKALPEPAVVITDDFAKPRDEIERILVKIWQDTLGIKAIGINDNFFELGGDSIKVIQISAKLKKYGLKLEISDLFLHPQIGELKKFIKGSICESDQNLVEGIVHLTPMQKWFFENCRDEPQNYCQGVMIYNENGLDENYVRKVFTKILIHHDALRIIFDRKENMIVQQNRGLDEKLFNYEINDLRNIKVIRSKNIKEFGRMNNQIDLKRGPLVKLKLFKTERGDYLLILIHHLVIDGISWRIILEDFLVGYQQIQLGKEIEFQDKSDSYISWSNKLREYSESSEILKELCYWNEMENIKTQRLPRDCEIKAEKRNYRNDVAIATIINKLETKKLLQKVNWAYNTEINDILLTALSLSIKEFFGIVKFFINIEGHGREKFIEGIDVSRTVGWFTSQFPIIIDICDVKDLSETIKVIKKILRSIPNKGMGYGILKYVTSENKKTEFNFKQEPELCFNYLGQFSLEFITNKFKISNMITENTLSHKSNQNYAIEINGVIFEGKMKLFFIYNRYEFKKDTIKKFVNYFNTTLKKITKHCIDKKEKEMTLTDFSSSTMIEQDLKTILEVLEDESQ